MTEYSKYTHLTINDIVLLIDIDERLERHKNKIDACRREGVDCPDLKKKMWMIKNKKKKILENKGTINISNVDLSIWDKMAKILGRNKRSAKANDLFKEFVAKHEKKN